MNRLIFPHDLYRHASSIEDQTRSRDQPEHIDAIENIDGLEADLGFGSADVGGTDVLHACEVH